MSSMKSDPHNGLILALLLLASGIVPPVSPLTGHVCHRQKAETYRLATNRAFLCSERYTAACGQLDWRR